MGELRYFACPICGAWDIVDTSEPLPGGPAICTHPSRMYESRHWKHGEARRLHEAAQQMDIEAGEEGCDCYACVVRRENQEANRTFARSLKAHGVEVKR